ncbi:type II toxin-antitoxin system RelE/ParE family toxin [Sphingomonas metalli]|nr:type II toxin-antitoxin system RelE/ParE family toxin [Sphingomonas metalli]
MTIIRTPAAQSDILDIWRYIAVHHPPAADAMVRRFDAKMTLLERHPLLDRDRWEVPGIRSLVIDRYLMLYRTIDDGVEIFARPSRCPRYRLRAT